MESGAQAVYLNAPSSRYRLGERLGAGGFTEVRRAALLGEAGFERTVAIKHVRSELRHDEQCSQRLRREALTLARLCHPNIVSAHRLERDGDDQLFLVLEFVDGVDLRTLVASGPLPRSVAIFIAGEILWGLRYARRVLTESGELDAMHAVSSHNILLSWAGAVKLADFGSSHESPGPAMSLDDRSDLFSVGITLWEMLTGERLLAEPIIRSGLIRPVPHDLEAVAMKLLERDPASGFPDVEAASDALVACEGGPRLGSLELERILAERFPEQAPRPAHRLAVRSQAVSPLEPPTATLYRRAPFRRATATALPRPRRRAEFAGLWGFFAVVIACAAVGAFVGVLGGRAVVGAWRSGKLEHALAVERGCASAPDMPASSKAGAR